MSTVPLPEFYRRVALDAVAANDKPALQLFRVTINRGEPLTLAYPSAAAAWDDAAKVAGPDARIEVEPVGRDGKVVPLPERLARHHVMLAELREDAQRIATQTLQAEGNYLTETEAGAFAIVPAAQLSEAQALEVDRQYGRLKDSGELRRRDDRHALDDQIQMQGCIGWLPV